MFNFEHFEWDLGVSKVRHSYNFVLQKVFIHCFLFEICFLCVVHVLLVLCAAKMFSLPWTDSDYNCQDQTKGCLFPIDYVLSITTLANGLSEHLNGTGDGRPIDLVIIVGLIMIEKKTIDHVGFVKMQSLIETNLLIVLTKKSQLIRRLIHLRPVWRIQDIPNRWKLG